MNRSGIKFQKFHWASPLKMTNFGIIFRSSTAHWTTLFDKSLKFQVRPNGKLQWFFPQLSRFTSWSFILTGSIFPSMSICFTRNSTQQRGHLIALMRHLALKWHLRAYFQLINLMEIYIRLSSIFLRWNLCEFFHIQLNVQQDKKFNKSCCTLEALLNSHRNRNSTKKGKTNKWMWKTF